MPKTLKASAIALAALAVIGLSGCSVAEGGTSATTQAEDERERIEPSPTEHGTYWETTPDGDIVLCAWAGKSSYNAGYGISCDWENMIPASAVGPTP